MQYEDLSNQYEKLSKLGQGSFGKVYLCRKTAKPLTSKQNQLPTSTISSENQSSSLPQTTTKQPKKQSNNQNSQSYYALKKMKNIDSQQTLHNLRQIKNLKQFNDHRNLMKMQGIVQNSKQYETDFYVVMEYGFEVKEFVLQKQIKLSNTILRQIICQIIKGAQAIHSHKYIHRDIKPSNIFVLKDGTVKLGDFSITRQLPVASSSEEGGQCQQKQNQQLLTGNVTTRYYRTPELLFGCKNYSKQIDIWSLGCTIAELILHQPLFPGQTQINQLQCIFRIIGYPQSQQWKDAQNLPYYFEFPQQKYAGLQNVLPKVEPSLLDLLMKMLVLDPKKRLTIQEICQHQYVKENELFCEELEKLSLYIYEKKIREQMQTPTK